MKAIVGGVLLAVLGALTAGAQAPALLLNNPEEVDFYYVLDPPALSGLDPAAGVFPSAVFDYFANAPAAGPTLFEHLAAGDTVRLEGLAEGDHLLVGFFTVSNRRDFPVRVLPLKVGGGMAERFYSVYIEPILFTARAGRGRLSAYPAAFQDEDPAGETQPRTPPATAPAPGRLGIAIDNQYEDWEEIPVYRGLAQYAPRSFSREQYGGSPQVLPLDQARYWEKYGTALNELKIVDDGGWLYLFVSTRSAMAEGLSLYLYFHDPKDPPAANRVTVELLPATANKAGLAALWVEGQAPLSIGSLASGPFFLEAALDKAAIGAALLSPPELAIVDLTTGYQDRAEYAFEEFYYLSFGFKDLPNPDTLQTATD